jgi:hypothetical protein
MSIKWAGNGITTEAFSLSKPCSQIHSTLLGDKVDYGIGLSYRPTSLCSLAGQCDNPMPL